MRWQFEVAGAETVVSDIFNLPLSVYESAFACIEQSRKKYKIEESYLTENFYNFLLPSLMKGFY
ncbi:MAG: hypothetical protein A2504_10660 [Bdellovibrionales bacterium RIFOXYD12_FULL_39_22]|nr:MAG: hypothetical protein A2385_14295 [Bdellovibrionales bacterium RIFOXYB1_FULL_39_21]OFZ40405.1 MAG: hypothetical protein A2485_02985 [Bdellovibrionales bacterium RIFOXYC12_FULL_39_17]OFZ49654.1 MAG: hypothetical protein A2404_09445 [Bdellovibrionales bacterium RIFOXYC1_FULL_39_130]OFZ70985.1 MAG: hypothetical protein A2451_14955 [Bdellovibrionales bacterium RIFOXYC2_FULL_39_8]OFZ77324.1 MAG: hypothetical protein A2560_06110 [Bdellovibrionales bacterium RIFOXYD1_FULL_39_84]OFZ95979.1 MAG: